jgi:hypothetical protein
MQAKKAAPTKADGAASAPGLDQVEDWLRTLPTAGSKDLDEAFPRTKARSLLPHRVQGMAKAARLMVRIRNEQLI